MRDIRAIGGLLLVSVAAAGWGCNDSRSLLSPWLQRNQSQIADKDSDADEPQILPLTYYAAGQLFEEQRQLHKAIQQYRRAIDSDPKFIAAYNRLGICLDKTGQFAEANDCFREAIRQAPDSAFLHNNLAFSLMMQKQWAAAEQQLSKACSLQPNYDRARVNLGIVQAKQAKFTDAYRQFESVLGQGLAHYNMGLLYKSHGLNDQAAESFRAALLEKPELAQAKKQLQNLQDTVAWATPPLDAVIKSSPPLEHAAKVPVQTAPRIASTVSSAPARIVERTATAASQAPQPATDTVADGPTVVDPDAWQVLQKFAIRESEMPPETPAARGPAPARDRAQAEPQIPVFVDDPPAVVDAEPLPLQLLASVPEVPFMLQNEPCEVEAIDIEVADAVKQVYPCQGDEVVDQFVFGHLGREDKPAEDDLNLPLGQQKLIKIVQPQSAADRDADQTASLLREPREPRAGTPAPTSATTPKHARRGLFGFLKRSRTSRDAAGQ